jgi:hypothetical protein
MQLRIESGVLEDKKIRFDKPTQMTHTESSLWEPFQVSFNESSKSSNISNYHLDEDDRSSSIDDPSTAVYNAQIMQMENNSISS